MLSTLSVPHSEQDYLKLREILDDLIDEAGNDEHHPLASLIETVGNLVDSYEQEYEPGYQGDPIDALRYLMEEHNLKQSDNIQRFSGSVCLICTNILGNRSAIREALSTGLQD